MSDGLLSADDVWQMVNLMPEETGLPMVVWASPRAGARHDARIKVQLQHGRKIRRNQATASIGVRPVAYIAAGQLRPKDQIAVFQWIGLNREALLDYWTGAVATGEFIARLKRL